MLQRLREGTRDAERTLAALRRSLPPEVAAQVWSATVRDGRLTILVRSAAWGTRLRYVAPEVIDALAAELGVAIDGVKVKVRTARS